MMFLCEASLMTESRGRSRVVLAGTLYRSTVMRLQGGPCHSTFVVRRSHHYSHVRPGSCHRLRHPDSLYGGLRSGACQEKLVVPAELLDGLHHVEPLPGVQVTELSVTAVHQVAGQRLRVELHYVLLQLVPG